jgi:Uma2 family endonuclease
MRGEIDMSVIAAPNLLTPDDLLNHFDDVGIELVNGRLVEKPMGNLSGFVGGRLITFVSQIDLRCENGWPLPAESGIQCFPNDPRKVRKPDFCYVRRERLREGPTDGWLRIAPDIAAEVMSPHDTGDEIAEKVVEYLRAGIRLVWVISPAARTVVVYRQSRDATYLTEEDLLTGEDIIPGFECMISDLFPPVARTVAQEPT